MLSEREIAQYHDVGFVVARAAVGPAEIDALRAELDGWIEESRSHRSNYGETLDGKMRFDLEPGHSAKRPRLRRVANPVDISEAYRKVLFDGPPADLAAQLVGPDVTFHHCKLNNKLPGMETRVDWHQDHAYDPRSNDDAVVALLLLDDMNEDNGCLMVVPGSHRERYSHYQDGRFTGATAPEHDADFRERAVPITGEAGDLCLMHTWCLHASAPNRSREPRRLLICDYSAADAVPLCPPHLTSLHFGRVVRGEPTRVARLKAGLIELPPAYEDDSFFSVQESKAAGGAG